MAPELLVNELQLKEASLADLIMADVWAYGMVVFNIINPGLKHPYELNIENCCVRDTPLNMLQGFAKEKEMPVAQHKYESHHQGEWANLKIIYESCTTICPSSRPSMKEVVNMMRADKRSTTSSSSTPHGNATEIHLRISQASAIGNVDQELLKGQEIINDQSVYHAEPEIPGDATNACAFLTILIAHELHESEVMSWRCIAETAESIITIYPHVFNRFRDTSLHYDIMEAYTMLKDNNCLPDDRYYLTECLLFEENALSQLGKEQLLQAMTKVALACPSYGFYTCDQFIFLIGSYDLDMFVLDTHEVPVAAGGKSTALLKRFLGTNEESAKECCRWLWKRLASSKLNGPQSLSMMVKHESESNEESASDPPSNAPNQQNPTLDNETVQTADPPDCADQEQSQQASAAYENRNSEDDRQHPSWYLIDEPMNEEFYRISQTQDNIGCSTAFIEQVVQRSPDRKTAKRKQVITLSSESDENSDIEIHSPTCKSSRITDEMESSSGNDEDERGSSRTLHHYNDDANTPVYEWATKVKSVDKVLPILLMEPTFATTCTRVPTAISDDVCFLIDTSKLSSHTDWKCDDMGAWKNNGVQRHKLRTPISDEDLLENEHVTINEHTVKRIYFKNNSSPDLRKYVTFLEEYPTIIFVQYLFDGKPHEVKPASHGNAKKISASGYIRTKESTKSRLQEITSMQTPKSAYHKVLTEKGGIRRASSASDLPRNREQAKYVRSISKGQRVNHIDSLVILLTQCKREQLQHNKKAFIREVTGAPEMRCVLGYDWQIEDLITFCTDPERFSVLGVDPTFNLGRFNVTVTTFRNQKVVDRVAGHHPIMIGPLLLSQTKSFDAYNYFFSKLVGLRKDTRNVLAYGTDGEEELYRALKYNFPHAVHLRCQMHFRENCKTQLMQSNIPKAQQKEILADIFGRKVGDTWENGLVDAKDEDDLRTKLSHCKDVWNRKESSYLPPNKKPKFYQYILEKVNMIDQCMSQRVRRNAGLGDPPRPYYTNDSESANAMIKRAVEFKENEISEFVREMSVLMQQQRDDVESAVFNKGPYELASSFRNFYISETEWFRKRTEQRDRHLERFHKAKMSNEKETETISTVPSQTVPRKVLTVNLLSANIQSLPAVTLQAIVKKSEELLNREGAITPAPGNDKAFMVESQTTTRPHFVEIKKPGKLVCDGCPSFASTKLCAHAVAASEKAGVLENYVKWFTKNGPTTMNLTSLITYDSSKDTGKKLTKASTARRKGDRGDKSRPVSSIVNRPFSAHSQSPQASQNPGAQQQSLRTPRQTLQAQDSLSHLPHEAMHSRYSAPQSHTPAQQSQQVQHSIPHLRHEARHQCQYTAPPQQPVPYYIPQPSNGTFEVHLLQFCHPNVKSCFGCSQALKPGDRVPDSPHDITIVSRMLRPFSNKTTGERMNKEGNVYFHVNLVCIRFKQPYFQPSMVSVGDWVASQLSMHHILLLRQFGMRI
ncbi:Mitogen-activated kinase kinase kinase A [Paramuricea clavata]|uniref:Mitogen-activated kinase kinase kinase A n=1 Tax=Paramuricea clavata TaxID=317549 RepID=A0A6S7IJ77_PARCT|nr:Mitogen-activated kinase kinase kinase A [Paramuricea clavata]